MMAALLYYSSEILEPELRTRLARLKTKKPTLTWANAKALIVKHMESPDARMTLINLTCAKRADGEALLDWIQCILSHKTKCAEVHMTLPETLWVDLAWCQITSTERQICGEKSNTLEELETGQSEFYGTERSSYLSSRAIDAPENWYAFRRVTRWQV